MLRPCSLNKLALRHGEKFTFLYLFRALRAVKILLKSDRLVQGASESACRQNLGVCLHIHFHVFGRKLWTDATIATVLSARIKIYQHFHILGRI